MIVGTSVRMRDEPNPVTANPCPLGIMRNRLALQFVLMIGIVNFFADFTYDGARGIVEPVLGSLGARAAIVGFVAVFRHGNEVRLLACWIPDSGSPGFWAAR